MPVRPVLRPFLILMAFAVATAAPLAQKGKNKPQAPDPIPGTAVIRCMDESDPLPDVVCADGMGAYVHGEEGVTAWLGTNGSFLLRVDTPERAHVVRFPASEDWLHDCDPICVGLIPDDGLIVYTESRSDSKAYIGAGNNLDGGLAGMGRGETAQITMLIGFKDPDQTSDIRWSLYWHPDYYVGTNYATATRSTDGCTWTITAADEALAGFWLFGTGRGRARDTQEGRFKAPVQIVFTADPATVPGGCSS